MCKYHQNSLWLHKLFIHIYNDINKRVFSSFIFLNLRDSINLIWFMCLVKQIPSDLLDKEFLPILQEEPLPPLALVPFTEEEQVCA